MKRYKKNSQPLTEKTNMGYATLADELNIDAVNDQLAKVFGLGFDLPQQTRAPQAGMLSGGGSPGFRIENINESVANITNGMNGLFETREFKKKNLTESFLDDEDDEYLGEDSSWLDKQVKSPKTGRMIKVRSLPTAERVKHKPKAEVGKKVDSSYKKMNQAEKSGKSNKAAWEKASAAYDSEKDPAKKKALGDKVNSLYGKMNKAADTKKKQSKSWEKNSAAFDKKESIEISGIDLENFKINFWR